MAEFKKVRIMVSSRCTSQVRDGTKWVALTDVRRRLQQELEDERLLGYPLFDVWISDSVQDQSLGDLETAWEKSLEEVRRSDIVLALYTGEAGWASNSSTIGICHAEFQEVWNRGQARLKVIRVRCKALRKEKSERLRDEKFKRYFEALNPTSSEAVTVEEILAQSKEALREAVASMVKLGSREAHKSRYLYGPPLDWSRMDFIERKGEMERALGDCLKDKGAEPVEGGWLFRVADTPSLTICHGLPAAFGVAAAREMVGQPFLKDHDYVKAIQGKKIIGGPIHLVACLKNITETQAMRQLGFPDATFVAGSFGIYVSDPVQKIQLVFLANCRDPTTTSNSFARFTEWLAASGESDRLANFARGRYKIVRAILDSAN